MFRGYLYNILIAAEILRSKGSKADIVAFFQLPSNLQASVIPADDVRLLAAMNVTIKYTPKSKNEDFYDIMLTKFQILGMLEYQRILFLDGDVMPSGNLDYIFEHSSQGRLKENVIIAGNSEPAQGGFFMLTPHKGDVDQIKQIIVEKEERGRRLPKPHFDENIGWGHVIQEPDKWELRKGITQKKLNRNKWDFYGAPADQGLLYYWTKYKKRNVSIVNLDEIQNWGETSNGTLVMEKRIAIGDVFGGDSPIGDHVHFTGQRKPWVLGPPTNSSDDQSSAFKPERRVWFETLTQLNQRFLMGVDTANWTKSDMHKCVPW